MIKNNYHIYKKKKNSQTNKKICQLHRNKNTYVENLFILKGKTIYQLQTNLL